MYASMRGEVDNDVGETLERLFIARNGVAEGLNAGQADYEDSASLMLEGMIFNCLGLLYYELLVASPLNV